VAYDSLGRALKLYIGYDLSETSYADAGTVSDDTIVEQFELAYDAAGNVIQITSRERLHDATGAGELTTIGGSQPKARVSYEAAWYDGVGRPVAAAMYGTNGDASLTRPGTAPARSDTVLVQSVEYNDAGEGHKFLDPKGIETRIVRDHRGRTTKTIEAYDDGDPNTGPSDRDRVTEYAFTLDGQVKSIKAFNSDTGDQLTRCLRQVPTYGIKSSTPFRSPGNKMEYSAY
jgi:hypothetical protein